MITDADLDGISGWFYPPDPMLFRFFLELSEHRCGVADLAEIGCCFGKSSVLIGEYRRSGEEFTVVDLFEDPAPDPSNFTENRRDYGDLTESAFRANYARFHSSPPRILRMDSPAARPILAQRRYRFVHIDGSHLYRIVRDDIETARNILVDNGIVAMDDYRSEHTPGVAAAAWTAARDGLRIVALSPTKLYGTWGDPRPWRSALHTRLLDSGVSFQTQEIFDDEIIRVIG
ncbi:class I SAM-dependent methyltransferase [Nocardia sp. NPDC057440]|uniref:class I SAM-dependent methyltransferase n=1 Tax=Nocardia sp. NPDC057440 TaxID=3346134 RepID=UPI00366C55BA